MSPAPESKPPSYNDTPAWTGAAPSSIVDTGDITSDSSSAHASPTREVSPSRSTSTAVASPPKLLVAGPTRSDTDPPPWSPLTQDIFLALGADPGQIFDFDSYFSDVFTPYFSIEKLMRSCTRFSLKAERSGNLHLKWTSFRHIKREHSP